MKKLLRYDDLKACGIVQNRMTLSRWQANQGFPKPIHIGPNTRAWAEDEVDAWLAQRAAARSGEAA